MSIIGPRWNGIRRKFAPLSSVLFSSNGKQTPWTLINLKLCQFILRKYTGLYKMINCGRKIHINDVEYNWTRREQNLPKYPPPLIIMLILDFGIENRNVCPTVSYPLWVFYVIIYGPYRWSLIILPFAASCASLFLAPTATVDWKFTTHRWEKRQRCPFRKRNN